MKFIVHVLIFAIGCGLGILWGVNNPRQAADVANREQVGIFKGKITLLNELIVNTSDPTKKAEYQTELATEQQHLADYQKTGVAPTN
jgi:hypothetical protein